MKISIRKDQRGMTLLEIMIVLAILGTLIAILASQVTKRLASAKVKEAGIQMAEIGKSLDMFYTDCGFYPESLNDLITQPGSCSNWGPEAYMRKLPKDPWGSEFGYTVDGGSYVLSSLGADRKEGGDGVNKDLSSADQ